VYRLADTDIRLHYRGVVSPLVVGVSGVVYNVHPSKKQALQAYKDAYKAGTVKII
jgi:hypothetical protein